MTDHEYGPGTDPVARLWVRPDMAQLEEPNRPCWLKRLWQAIKRDHGRGISTGEW